MPTVDFHCHTRYSKDCLVDLPSLLVACDRKGLDQVAITDHDTLAGAREAINLAPARFIASEEIMTKQGELLAYFVTEEIPGGLPARQTIELLRSQGAFISIPHPFDRFRKGRWRMADLLEIYSLVDAIEMFNSRCLMPQDNLKAIVFAQQHHLLGTVGSDAHSLREVGAASLTLPEFQDASSLKRALSRAEPHHHFSPPWVHFISRYASWRKRNTSQA